VNILKYWENCLRDNMLICRNFAISRNLWKAIVPPLHGGGQEFESLGSTLKVVVCRENPSRKESGK
jgi:hypothetical protein